MNEEIWRDVKGYEGHYKVSNTGKIKSLNYNKTKVERILKNAFDKNGYLQIQLMVNGKRKVFRVHRLVAEAFIPNPLNLPCINHKSEFEKTNNNVENLEWCTVKYNNNYGTHQQRVAAKKIGKKLSDETKRKISMAHYGKKHSEETKILMSKNKIGKPMPDRYKKVYQYDDRKLIKTWESVKSTEKFGFDKSNVGKCCRGVVKKYKGFKWSYILEGEDDETVMESI